MFCLRSAFSLVCLGSVVGLGSCAVAADLLALEDASLKGSRSESGIPKRKKKKIISVNSPSTAWRSHTTELVVDALSSVDSGENSTIEKELHHNLLPIATKQVKDLCPCTVLENLDILIRKLRHNAWNTGLLNIPHHRRALEAMRQQMLGL
jgi:hypothetical protein